MNIKKAMLKLRRVLLILLPLFVVSYMSTDEWIARSQMIENETQKQVVYNTVFFINEKLHKKEISNNEDIEKIAFSKNVQPAMIEQKERNNDVNDEKSISNEVKNKSIDDEKSSIVLAKTELTLDRDVENRDFKVENLGSQENVKNSDVKKAVSYKKILLVGDSLMSEIAFGLKDHVSKNVKLKDIHKSSTGLTNRDYYQWDNVAYKAVTDFNPDLVFIHMGGNDGQDMKVNGRFVKLYSPEWESYYYERVKQLIEKIKKAKPDVEIVWVGLPGMRDQKYERKTAIIRAAQKKGAIDSGIGFIDAGDAIGRKYVKQAMRNGKMLDLRRTDGIHYSRSGGDQIAQILIKEKNIEKK